MEDKISSKTKSSNESNIIFRKVKKGEKNQIINPALLKGVNKLLGGSSNQPLVGTDIKEIGKKKEELYNVTQKTTPRQRQQIRWLSDKNRSSLPQYFLSGIQYKPMTKLSIEKQSVFVCSNNDLSGYNTPDDDRLGVLEKGSVCSTCSELSTRCPGHMSYIPLPQNVIIPTFRPIVIQFLKMFCHTCSRPILSNDEIKQLGSVNSNNFFKTIADLAEKRPCRNLEGKSCSQNPKIAPDNNTTMDIAILTNDKEGRKYLRPARIKKILSGITEEDARAYGLENGVHPRDFIADFFPVNAPQARRYNQTPDGQIKQDPLTVMIENIRFLTIQHGLVDSDDKKEALKNRINTEIAKIIYADPTSTGASKSDGIKGIAAKLKGKYGLAREAMAKRSDFSARTPIDPNGKLRFGEIGIPEGCSKIISVPEVITYYNWDRIMKLVDEGKIQRYIMKDTNTLIEFDITKKDFLNIGDTIERDLENGDIIIFNRQPTIHKGSLAAYIVVLVKGKTFNIHLSSTKQHGADFDGDESNVSFLQFIEAICEGAFIAIARMNISNIYSSNSNGIAQNALTGWFVLTEYLSKPSNENPETYVGVDKIIFDDEDFYEGLKIMSEGKLPSEEEMDKRIYEAAKYMAKNKINEILEKKVKSKSSYSKKEEIEKEIEKYKINRRSGRALFSYSLPEGFCYENGSVKIVNGVLILGQLKSSAIGTSPSTIIKYLDKNYSGEVASDFISNITFSGYWYVEKMGFTIGYKDCMFPKEHAKEMKIFRKNRVDRLNKEIIELSVTDNQLVSEFEKEEREAKKKSLIDQASTEINNKFLKMIPKSNNMFPMIDSGSKGKETALTDVMIIIGQQRFDNVNRLPKKCSRSTRASYAYDERDNCVESRGFCGNCFSEGLTHEGFKAMMAGARESICNVHVDVSSVGHTNRQIAKMQEDCITKEDGSVRNDRNHVLFLTLPFDLERQVIVGGKILPVDLENIAFTLNNKYAK